MIEAEIPKNEMQRLAHLQNLHVLDTPIEQRFERITRILCRILDMPLAAITLIDDNRQWFKSIQGAKLVETPRSVAFCSHTILNDEILVIPDATVDNRFYDNPLVINEPNIRFYAGYPLKVANNIRVGALCVFDIKPRNLSLEDCQFLEDLAITTVNQMKLSMFTNLLT